MNRDSLLGIHMVILYNSISFILHRICICNELLIVAQNQNPFSEAGGQLSFKPFTACIRPLLATDVQALKCFLL